VKSTDTAARNPVSWRVFTPDAMPDAPITPAVLAADALSGQHVLVTGGGTGLGRAMALRCGALGASVTVCGRRAEPLEQTASEISRAGGTANGVTCDIRDPESIARLFDQAEEAQGPITALVNNAAGNFLAPTETISPNGFDAIVKTNLYGTFYCTQEAGKRWIERQNGGAVVSISTTYAETGSAFVVPSAVSKAGIVALTKSLAAEWGRHGIRLVAVAPGPFPTDGAWSRLVPPEMQETVRRRVPLGRTGDPAELAELIAFLLSPGGAFISGEHLVIDGGEVPFMAGMLNDFLRIPPEKAQALFERLRSAAKG
jgi:NAD(P)-dependent dehydrogenase (short-subunit alcohol dehydrogenase family)